MANSIVTNTAANTALRYMQVNSAAAQSSVGKLSSGSRIVKASDDAASLAIGTKLKADVTALKQAAVNASHATSVLQVADGGMARIADILQRMKSLAVQAQSGSISDSERTFLDREFQALLDQIDTTAQQTRFNGESLLGRREIVGFNSPVAGTGVFAAGTGEVSGVYADGGVLKPGVTYTLSVDYTDNGTTGTLDDGDTAKVTLTGSDGSVFTSATLTHDGTNGPNLSAVDPDAIVLTDASGNVVRLAQNGGATLNLSADSSNLGTFRVQQDSFSVEIAERTGNFASGTNRFFVHADGNALSPGVTYFISGQYVDVDSSSGNNNGDIFTVTLTGTDGTVFSKTFTHDGSTTDLTKLDFSGGVTLESEDGRTVTLTGLGTLATVNGGFGSTETLSGTFSTRATTSVQVGVLSGDTVHIRLRGLTTADLGGTVTDADGNTVERATLADADGTGSGTDRAHIRTREDAVLAGNIIDRAIAQVNAARAEAGAQMSRFEFVSANIATSIENMDAARSTLMDVDVAAEMTQFTSAQVLMQANVAMLAQANQLPQNLLRLLQ